VTAKRVTALAKSLDVGLALAWRLPEDARRAYLASLN